MKHLSSLLILPALAAAQTESKIFDHNAHAWYMYFGDHKFSRKWGLHAEGQWRRSDASAKWQQFLIRPGINYHVNRNVMLTAGYGFIKSYPYGDFPSTNAAFPEHRIYQQALVKQKFGRVDWQHRLRSEQRWIGAGQAWRAQDRFRYMGRADLPLKGPWSLGIYNEIFLNYGRNVAPGAFDQNRAYVAAGYKAGTLGRIEFGYMHQAVAQRNGRVIESNHTLQVAFFSSAPVRPGLQ
jgi:hypothetical protein